jgi:hypothetical protein
MKEWIQWLSRGTSHLLTSYVAPLKNGVQLKIKRLPRKANVLLVKARVPHHVSLRVQFYVIDIIHATSFSNGESIVFFSFAMTLSAE